MRSWPTWLGLFVGLAALALGLLLGSDEQEGWQLAARFTARASYPFFLATFVASSLLQLYCRLSAFIAQVSKISGYYRTK